MIVSKLFSKFKSLFYPNVPDQPHFIINPHLEKVNKGFYEQNLSSLSFKLNMSKYCAYTSMYFDLCMLSRGFNNRDHDPAPNFDTLIDNVVIPIDKLLQFNQQYMCYLVREKHNIMLNSLLDKTYIPPKRLKLVHTEEERELLFALRDRIKSLSSPSNVDKNLIVQIRDVINQLCPDNLETIKYIKDPELDAIAKGRGALTHEESASIYSFEALIVEGHKYNATVYQVLSQQLITLQQVNEYLETKL
jgi:hypothetical protein